MVKISMEYFNFKFGDIRGKQMSSQQSVGRFQVPTRFDKNKDAAFEDSTPGFYNSQTYK